MDATAKAEEVPTDNGGAASGSDDGMDGNPSPSSVAVDAFPAVPGEGAEGRVDLRAPPDLDAVAAAASTTPADGEAATPAEDYPVFEDVVLANQYYEQPVQREAMNAVSSDELDVGEADAEAVTIADDNPTFDEVALRDQSEQPVPVDATKAVISDEPDGGESVSESADTESAKATSAPVRNANVADVVHTPPLDDGVMNGPPSLEVGPVPAKDSSQSRQGTELTEAPQQLREVEKVDPTHPSDDVAQLDAAEGQKGATEVAATVDAACATPPPPASQAQQHVSTPRQGTEQSGEEVAQQLPEVEKIGSKDPSDDEGQHEAQLNEGEGQKEAMEQAAKVDAARAAPPPRAPPVEQEDIGGTELLGQQDNNEIPETQQPHGKAEALETDEVEGQNLAIEQVAKVVAAHAASPPPPAASPAQQEDIDERELLDQQDSEKGLATQQPHKDAGAMKGTQTLRQHNEEEKHEVERLRQEAEASKKMQKLEQEWGQSNQVDGQKQASALNYASDYSSEQSVSTGLRRKEAGISKRRMKNGSYPLEGDIANYYDVENQSTSASPRGRGSEKLNLNGRSLPGVSKASRGRGFPAVVILRKIVHAIITDLDDETLRRPDTEPIFVVIALIKEAILGIVIAFVLVSVVLFVDHRFLLGLPLARNYRKASFHLMQDKESLENFENETGLKFVDMEDYMDMVQEIKMSANKTKAAVPILKQRSKDLDEARAEKAVVEPMHNKMFADLKIDQFCEECVWSKHARVSCDGRAHALEETYGTPKFEAMISAMKKDSCRKSPKQMEEDKKRVKKEDELLKVWPKEKDYCGSCDWDSSISCSSRAMYLMERYGVATDRAQIRVMLLNEKCRMSTKRIEDEKLAKFCWECTWGNKMTCQQRVEYLQYTYKNSEREATFAAMKKPSCVREDDASAEGGSEPKTL